jgi:hypothetical protein
MRKPFLASLMLSAFLGIGHFSARADVIDTLHGTGNGVVVDISDTDGATAAPAAFLPDLSGTVRPTPVPEPSMVVLGGLGGLLVVGYRRIRSFCCKG